MTKKTKKKTKKKLSYPSGISYASAFAPIFPNRMGTPVTTHDAPPSPPAVPAPPSEAIIPASYRRVMHEMRMVVGKLPRIDETGPYSGMYAPNAQSGRPNINPEPSGPGFSPSPVKGSQEYDFARSPGLGFRTEKAWKIWRAALDIMPSMPGMTVGKIIKTAMTRVGVGLGQVDASEISLLEMGIQWYLSNPGR